MAQRKGAADERKRTEKAEKARSATDNGASAPKTGKGKLSFKQKFALENLPKEMEKAEAQIAKHEKEMADPNLFSKNPSRFSALASELEKLRGSITKMEEEWLELEMLREEIEG
jgi:ATP-binding cassette subfamily F protein uup